MINILNALKIGKGVVSKTPDIISTIGDIKNRAEERKSGNVEKENERNFELSSNAMDEFSKEFTESKNWFDSFINGVNRLPRPAFALLTFTILAAYDSAPFFLLGSGTIHYQEFLVMIEKLLNQQYWIFGIIITFYFGSRTFEKFTNTKQDSIPEKKIEIVEPKKTLNVNPNAPDKVKKFFNNYRDTVLDIEKNHNLLAVGILSHAGLECGWGDSILKAKDLDTHQMIITNNVFNIKSSKEWSGKKAYREVWEDNNKDGKYQKDKETEKAFFKVYPTIIDSFKDYVNLLTTNPRYHKMTEAKNPKEYGQYLYECGYMTDGKAAEKIETIANSYFIF